LAFTVEDSFKEFIKNISISCDYSNMIEKRSNLVINLLAKRFDVLEIFPVGSLVTYTTVEGCVNIDIILVLHYSKYIRNNTPLNLLEKIKEVLNDFNIQITSKNTHAVILKFSNPPNVNIIPASRVSYDGVFSHYNIPSIDKDIWIASNPKIHTKRMRDLSICKSQLVQMVKEWNKQNLGYLSSFHIDNMVLTYEEDIGFDFAWHMCKFFKHMSHELETNMINPNGLGSNIDAYLDDNSRIEILKIINKTTIKIYNAWYDIYSGRNHKVSIETYCECFGTRYPKYG